MRKDELEEVVTKGILILAILASSSSSGVRGCPLLSTPCWGERMSHFKIIFWPLMVVAVGAMMTYLLMLVLILMMKMFGGF